jgi:hypothetical protein
MTLESTIVKLGGFHYGCLNTHTEGVIKEVWRYTSRPWPIQHPDPLPDRDAVSLERNLQDIIMGQCTRDRASPEIHLVAVMEQVGS